jgi:Ca-activated chloride channel family protein
MAAYAPAPMMMEAPDYAAAPPPPVRASRGLMRPKRAAPSGLRGMAPKPAAKPRETVDPFQAVRVQAEAEAVRLRALTDAPAYERREALADLGTRLDALVRELPGGDLVERVRDLVRDLAEDRLAGADLDALWQRTLSLLNELARAGNGQEKGSKPFWKR